jgi:hypothetical protein
MNKTVAVFWYMVQDDVAIKPPSDGPEIDSPYAVKMSMTTILLL